MCLNTPKYATHIYKCQVIISAKMLLPVEISKKDGQMSSVHEVLL